MSDAGSGKKTEPSEGHTATATGAVALQNLAIFASPVYKKRVIYEISDDPQRLDFDVIHRFLSEESYWAKNIPRELVERSAAHSLCFGVYAGTEQVGFARVVSDRATFAYLADVFILSAHRGQGLSKRLMAAIIAHPDLQRLRRWMLVTGDAHGLYRQHGFAALAKPERFMERREPISYGGDI